MYSLKTYPVDKYSALPDIMPEGENHLIDLGISYRRKYFSVYSFLRKSSPFARVPSFLDRAICDNCSMFSRGTRNGVFLLQYRLYNAAAPFHQAAVIAGLDNYSVRE